jgi:uncharacterized protein (TIGR02217 family)
MAVSPVPLVGVVEAADLATHPDVFPMLPGRGFLMTKAPEFSTGLRKATSGREVRTAWMSAPRWWFKVRHEFLRNLAAKPEVGAMLAFFMSRLGRFGFFFYFDETDHTAEDQVFGVGDGGRRTFQMVRTVGAGTPYSYIEPVYALWKRPVVKVGGVVKVYGADYVIEPWGRLVFSAAPASGAALTWTGDFLFVCRFDDDRLDLAQLSVDLWSQDGFEFVSLKP